ncbi:hypothetical protein LTR91_013583 [Friedmanniomyces endolithicus]|uniref:Sec39 domain-containing protein n=1 Tax=Friedmanniomyces endolithicus TaxID=329885 RepID=A0AAN6KDI5_9PEZI|nr:hypothetical protein LTR75_008850 [Friedmanniomyces endolithicus]KAK0846768.1 hypothetical protein LTR03_006652 [Friedmanniomyces endolithicus]KAK0906572.1 hypothetical protein LTR02_005905 [Friedmanniomyces endolithicus]KAK0914320.1 hypothetical protein LTR57_014012 [Friedmanniomyces endolithicus]KAK0976742.1 hypothetical protein LTR91_013583 [Friedmanniomyces endolithicus]
MAKQLSGAQCILLTVHYASSANIKALHSFTPTRSDVLEPDLILRILLTYLPESVEPKEYASYVEEVASRLYLDYEREEVDVDLRPVKDLSEEQAQKQVKRLHLREYKPMVFPPSASDDLLNRFLISRGLLMDEQAGLLNLVPHLVEPFLPRNEYLRTWYISVVLPVIRLELEYYSDQADSKVPQMSLSDFANQDPAKGIDFLLRKALEMDGTVPMVEHSNTSIGRDVKGLVGPWMYGHTERKRRKMNSDSLESARSAPDTVGQGGPGGTARKVPLDGITDEDKTGHDWEGMFRWMVANAKRDLTVIAHLIEDWDGPSDVDLGGYSEGGREYIDEEVLRKLELQYAQAAFAACYAAEGDTQEIIRGAHGILARLAELLDFLPPPDLASSVDSLPLVERQLPELGTSDSVNNLTSERLLEPEHPLTTPRMETYMLLQMLVYSTYQLAGLGLNLALIDVAKLLFYASAEEQLAVLQKVLHGLTEHSSRKDEAEWDAQRKKLMWIWNWGIDVDDEQAQTGAGVLGRIKRELFEEEMLKVFIDTGCRIVCVDAALATKNKRALLLTSRYLAYTFTFPVAVNEVDPGKNAEELAPGDELDTKIRSLSLTDHDGNEEPEVK